MNFCVKNRKYGIIVIVNGNFIRGKFIMIIGAILEKGEERYTYLKKDF